MFGENLAQQIQATACNFFYIQSNTNLHKEVTHVVLA
jgi:hypothetical protein